MTELFPYNTIAPDSELGYIDNTIANVFYDYNANQRLGKIVINLNKYILNTGIDTNNFQIRLTNFAQNSFNFITNTMETLSISNFEITGDRKNNNLIINSLTIVGSSILQFNLEALSNYEGTPQITFKFFAKSTVSSYTVWDDYNALVEYKEVKYVSNLLAVSTFDKPFITSVNTTGGSTIINFLPPINTGGSSIVKYTVFSNPDNKQISGSSSPLTLEGLDSSKDYNFIVLAENSGGYGVTSLVEEIFPDTQIIIHTDNGYIESNQINTVSLTQNLVNKIVSVSIQLNLYSLNNQVDNNYFSIAFNPYLNFNNKNIFPNLITTSNFTISDAFPGDLSIDTISIFGDNTLGFKLKSITNYSSTPLITFNYVSNIPISDYLVSAAYNESLVFSNPIANAFSSVSEVTAVAGNAQATISYSEITTETIVEYIAVSTPGNITSSVSSYGPITVTGLTNGTSYTFAVLAVKSDGTSSKSSQSNAVTPFTIPGTPTITSVTPGDQSVIVYFTAPTSNGGSSITGYRVTSSGGQTKEVNDGSATSITITGLTNGTSYTFTVAAENVAGYGSESTSSSSVTPRTVPGAPTITSVTPGDQSVTINFTAPTSDGGSAITGYRVTSSGGQTKEVEGNPTSITITGLTNGTSYTFTVAAKNVAGYGSESTSSSSVTPSLPPGAPTITSVTPGNESVTVVFTAPTSDGGSSITGYRVTSSNNDVKEVNDGSATSITITGLTNGTSYSFTVAAKNGTGYGSESDSSSLVTPRTVPGTPTITSVTPGNESVTIVFTAPTSDGGSSITGYRVTSSNNDVKEVNDGSTTSITITGLTNGTSYTFTVAAKNVAGYGSESTSSSSVTPRTVPGTPTITSVTPGNESVTIVFTAPTSDGGSSITGYRVTSSNNDVKEVNDGSATSITITGLTNGTSYTFTVAAKNVAGYGSESTSSSSVTPRTVPGAPTITSVTPGNESVTAVFTAPTSNGGSSITGYRVTSSGGQTKEVNDGSATSITITGLTNGTSYTFTVAAKNVAGYGSESTSSSSVTPRTVPGTPTITSVTPGDESVTVVFTAPTQDGGSSITGYRVTSSGGQTKEVNDGSTTSITITGLTNGTSYTFTVAAKNVAGYGSESESSSSVTPRTVPSAPEIIYIIEGNRQVTVTFTEPNNGGAEIIKYIITTTPGNIIVETEDANELTKTITGLLNGVGYRFKVRAENEAGLGVESELSIEVIPRGTPDKPININVETYGTFGIVYFNPGYNGGYSIIDYTVKILPENRLVIGNNSPILISGLENNSNYSISVYGRNEIGNGEESDLLENIVSTNRDLNYEETVSTMTSYLSSVKNTQNISRIQAKNNVRSLLNSEKNNRIIPTTVDKVLPLTRTSIYNSIQTKLTNIILLGESETLLGSEPPIIDITQPIIRDEIVYFPIKANERFRFRFRDNVYTCETNNSNNEITAININNSYNINSIQNIFDELKCVIFGGFGIKLNTAITGGAGSDPYITSLYGYTYELPKIERWWNLFTDHTTNFMILAETKNIGKENYFSRIKVVLGKNKIIIDYNKKIIEPKIINENIKIGKIKKLLKYKKGEDIIEEEKEFDCIQIYEENYEEVIILVNWRNNYFHPIFKVFPKNGNGLLMYKQPINKKNKLI